MENPRSAIADRVKESNNVLVTVSANPSVDQLAAAIGLTLVLNKLGKHATAVFSGAIPSTIEFLQPEKTIEKNTDSLRDFIISLDKAKADKLRYKVEDKVVKIFITPYRTSISDKDLEFSQGDFNVDLVLALGVHRREDLDQAITAHGRILHDATVATVNTQSNGELGSINWVETNSSSLCEMAVGLSELVKTGLLDGQIATAFLTGIVAETNRFSNTKTTSETMAMSAKLMSAGANQQLVATKLEGEPSQAPPESSEQADDGTRSGNPDGSLAIDHGQSSSPVDQIQIDEHGTLRLADGAELPADEPKLPEPPSADMNSRPVITTPPSLGGKLTANSEPEGLEPSVDPLSLPPLDAPILSHDAPLAVPEPLPSASTAPPPAAVAPEPVAPTVPEPPTDSQQTVGLPVTPIAPDNTPIAASVPEPTVENPPEPTPPTTISSPSLDDARNAVLQAVASSPSQSLEPIAALNAQPVDLNLGHDEMAQESSPPASEIPAPAMSDADVASDPGLPPNISFNPSASMPSSSGPSHSLIPPDNGLPTDNTAALVDNPTAPPPVPPPMMPPPFGQPKSDEDVAPQDPLAPL